MDGHDTVTIGASTGSVEALITIVGNLPEDFPAVFVVVHFPPEARSLLPDILTRHGPLPASHAEDREPIGEALPVLLAAG